MAHGVSGTLLEERLGGNGGCERTGRGISLVSLWGDVEGMFFFMFFILFFLLFFFFFGRDRGDGDGDGEGGVDCFFLSFFLVQKLE